MLHGSFWRTGPRSMLRIRAELPTRSSQDWHYLSSIRTRWGIQLFYFPLSKSMQNKSIEKKGLFESDKSKNLPFYPNYTWGGGGGERLTMLVLNLHNKQHLNPFVNNYLLL